MTWTFMLHCIYLSSILSYHTILLHSQLKEKKKPRKLKMGSKKLFLLVLCLAVFVGICSSWGDEVVEDAKDKAEEAKEFASEAMHDAKESTESWANWARDKFSESFGSEKDDQEKHLNQNMKYQAQDAASRATGTMKSAASGASEYASEKATDAKEAISGAMAYGREKTSEGVDEIIRMPTDKVTDAKDKMGETMGEARDRMADTYEGAKQKMYKASDKASNMAHNAKDNMAESIGYGRERAENAYDQGKQRVNMVSDMASEKFYDAKDKASDVYDEARHKVSHMASGNANNERINMASQRVYDVKNKVKGAMDCGRDKANEAKDKMGVAMGYGSDKVAETFDQAKHEVGGAYLSAKNTMTEEAKAKYEAAKEKASEATGELGAKMRNTPQV